MDDSCENQNNIIDKRLKLHEDHMSKEIKEVTKENNLPNIEIEVVEENREPLILSENELSSHILNEHITTNSLPSLVEQI